MLKNFSWSNVARGAFYLLITQALILNVVLVSGAFHKKTREYCMAIFEPSEGRRVAYKVEIKPPPHPHGEDLLEILKGGGNFIWFRHFHTKHTKESRDAIEHRKENLYMEYFDDCSQQRVLSDYGNIQSTQIGEAMRKLGIPVQKVLTSPYCRTRNGAENLGFGKPEKVLELIFRKIDYLEEEENAFVADLLTRPPEKGSNTIVMAHRTHLDEYGGAAEGEALIFTLDEKGTPKLVGRITADEWMLATFDPAFLGVKSAKYRVGETEAPIQRAPEEL